MGTGVRWLRDRIARRVSGPRSPAQTQHTNTRKPFPTAPRASSSRCSHPPHFPPLLLLPTARSNSPVRRCRRQTDIFGCPDSIPHSEHEATPQANLRHEGGWQEQPERWEPQQKTLRTRGPPTPQPVAVPVPSPGTQGSSRELWETPSLPAAASSQEQQAPEQRSLWKGSECPGDSPQPPPNPPCWPQPPPPLPPPCR